jgi:hypothetical protein
MMWPFKRKKAPLIEIGGIEPGLSKDEKAYRKLRIAEIAEYTQKSLEEATALADKWFIRTLQVQIGDEPMKIMYCPCPVWDDEWMWRETFETKEEAFAHVQKKRGELLVPDLD